MAAANIVVDKHSPDEFDKLSLPDTTEIQQGRTYFLNGGSGINGHYLLRNSLNISFW